MFRKIFLGALVAVSAFGFFAVTEAAQSNYDNYCYGDGYCYADRDESYRDCGCR